MADRADRADRAAVADGTNRRTRSAVERFALLLSIVPWLASRDGATVDEICTHFAIDRRQLLKDLDVVPMVGLPPYTPDTLVELEVTGDWVSVRLPQAFSRPLRLTPEEALALITTGTAADAVVGGGAAGGSVDDGQGPLASGVAKLADLLGIEVDEAVSVELGHSDPSVRDLLREAVAARQQVQLDYYSYSRDERTERTVDPYLVFFADGHWYLHAHCHRAGSPRLFRVDRIAGADRVDARFERDPEVVVQPGVFDTGPDTPRVTLALAAEARWVAEQYPVESREEGEDGRILVRLVVAAPAWLEKLLVRLGPAAEVVDSTDGSLADVRSPAAARVLARYRADRVSPDEPWSGPVSGKRPGVG